MRTLRRSRKDDRWPLAIIASLICAFVGCKVGPEYRLPWVSVPQDWSQQHHPSLKGDVADLTNWWNHFNDPALNHLVAQAETQNLTLREAGQRILEAQARRNVVAGNLYPQTQSVSGGYSKSRLSSQTANFFTFPGVFDTDVNPENWLLGMNLAWEVDFWGRYRRAVESADASLDVALAANDEARVVLMAEVARTYTEVRALERRLNIAQEAIRVQQQTLDIATQKLGVGLGTGIDVAQAEANLRQTEATRPTLEIARRQAHHRLCVLVGTLPTDLTPVVGWTGQIPMPPSALGFGIPADLLRRRPDIRRTERALASQSARIGIAESEFYPHISLNGNIGFSAENLSDLFGTSSASGFISPQFTWNLLNYSRIKNNVLAEKAVFEQRCTAYYASVLAAAQEAEDAQVAYVYGFDRVNSLHKSIAATESALQKSTDLYKAGSIDFGRIYVLQADLLRQQDALAAAEASVTTSLIDLFKSLGGGWESSTDCHAKHVW
jgi:NodT family efflux transporter outer membrane factor (OMF) lipoprotein